MDGKIVKNNIIYTTYFKRRISMSKMGWLHHLVEIAHHNDEEIDELKGHLGDLGFKNPKLAADQFLKAIADIEEDKAKKGDNNGNDNKTSR